MQVAPPANFNTMRITTKIEGAERTDKVECQACGKSKELGVRCEDCGFPLIEVRPTAAGGFLLMLPLCPSTNDRMRPIRMGRFARDILTDEARDYVTTVAAELAPILKRAEAYGFRKMTTWKIVPMWFVLPRTTADCHNYFKCLCDALEDGGFVENDRLLMVSVRGVHHDSDTCAVVELTPGA